MMYDIIWCMKSYVDVPGKPNQIHTNFIYDVCKCVCLYVICGELCATVFVNAPNLGSHRWCGDGFGFTTLEFSKLLLGHL